MRKIIAAIIIVFALIVVGVTGLVIKNNKSESDTTVLKDNKEIKSFEVQYKNDNVKITDSDTVKAMTSVTVISDTMIMIGKRAYTCDKIDISKLDELTGIDREK